MRYDTINEAKIVQYCSIKVIAKKWSLILLGLQTDEMLDILCISILVLAILFKLPIAILP